MVSELVCDGPADCWHLTGAEIEAALGQIDGHHGLTADGGEPSPTLPSNWSAVNQLERTVFQRRDIDHYVVLAEGTEEWTVLLFSQGDRAYPAPLGVRTLPVAEDPASAVQELVAESNDLVEPAEGGLRENLHLSGNDRPVRGRGRRVLGLIGLEHERYNDRTEPKRGATSGNDIHE